MKKKLRTDVMFHTIFFDITNNGSLRTASNLLGTYVKKLKLELSDEALLHWSMNCCFAKTGNPQETHLNT